MSPTTSEKVVNNALSGTELKELLRADFEKLLENDGMLSGHVAYGRFGYELSFRLQTGNPSFPESSIMVTGGESLPLIDPPGDSVTRELTLKRNVDSPNKERIRTGLTVPVVTRGLDGTIQTEQIKYPPQPELGEGDVSIENTTARAIEDMKSRRR